MFHYFASIAVATLLFTVGCSPKLPYDVVELAGTLTYKGEPLEGVIVHFRPSTGRESSAMTTEGGKFVMLYTYDLDGVQTGHGEFFLSLPMSGGGVGGGKTKKNPAIAEAVRKYSMNGTPLAVQITEPNRDYKLELK